MALPLVTASLSLGRFLCVRCLRVWAIEDFEEDVSDGQDASPI